MKIMDKSCHSSVEESSSSSAAINPNPNPNPTNPHLNQIHKLSHKISKPPIRKPFEFDHNHNNPQIQSQPLILDHHHQNESQPSNLNNHLQQQQQHQPPVYNVSKSDFRDVVQKLTGSPAHERIIKPVQVQSQLVKPQSSRLQRIRPPPLDKVGKFPLPGENPRFFSGTRPLLSPLPPLPAVHATAESPISAYMRCFQTNVTGFGNPLPVQQNPSGLLSQPELHASIEFHAPPSSPLPFGCLSPGFQFSPARFQQLTPLSPTPPAPSPRWKSN